MPWLVQVLLRHLPEQVRVADGRKYVVGLHAVVAVVGPKLQKFRQVLVPGVQVNGHRALAHAQLVHGHRRVVHQLHPADHAPRRALKAADAAARGPDLSEIKAHAAAKFADLGKIVDAAVNALQAVRHRVDKAAGKLVEGLSGVGQGGRGHGNLHVAQHIVKTAHPGHAAVRLLLHGQMQGDSQVHLLGRLQRLALVVLDHIALDQQIQAGVGEQLVPLRIQKGLRLPDLRLRVVF